MARKYTLKRRAEGQAGTRARIIEAAVALHGTIGPARTTVSMVAEKAGVQRHTLYAHFPDERSLLMACSGHHLEVSPPPDPGPWAAIADPRERLGAGLGEIYGWFERNAALIACVLADAEHHPLVREVSHLRFGPHFEGWGAALADGADGPMLRLALSFHTWRTLVGDAGLDSAGAAAAMASAVAEAGRAQPRVAAAE
ncbi:MAG: helix-turn-helix domain-containing protein [Amaricoccus sp.]